MSPDLEYLRVVAAGLGIKADTYRVGWGHHLHVALGRLRVRKWRSAWWYLRRAVVSLRDGLRLPWQCESNVHMNARRGLTAHAAETRMLRDAINHAIGPRCNARPYTCRWHPVKPRDHA